MSKRKTDVKQHPRQLRSGRTKVKRHKRRIKTKGNVPIVVAQDIEINKKKHDQWVMHEDDIANKQLDVIATSSEPIKKLEAEKIGSTIVVNKEEVDGDTETYVLHLSDR